MRLAEAAGLSVPECYLDTIGDQPLFVIERFDRMVLPEDDRRGWRSAAGSTASGGDFANCQPLPGAITRRGLYAKVRDALWVLFGSGARYRGARLLVVNAVLGNCDGHLQEPHRAWRRRPQISRPALLIIVPRRWCTGASIAIWPCTSGRPTRSTRSAETISSPWRRSWTFRRAW
ncbi:MAG: HipA domain-containing protein [Adlercreutzia equolifaciens]